LRSGGRREFVSGRFGLPNLARPRKDFENDVGIALVGFGHEPAFVTSGGGVVGGGAHGAWLGAVGGVDIGADFDLEMLERSAVVRLEKIVENLAALRFWIVDEQTRGSSGAGCGQGRRKRVQSPRRRGTMRTGAGVCAEAETVYKRQIKQSRGSISFGAWSVFLGVKMKGAFKLFERFAARVSGRREIHAERNQAAQMRA